MLKKIRKKKWTRSEKFLLLAAMPLYFILVGLLVQPVSTILPGLWIIIREADVLITDYFVVGGIGAAFINAGILTLLCLFIVYKSGLDVDGHTVTSTFLMFGFSLFGKNLLNIWMILLGVWFYAKYHKTAPSRYIYIALYGTSLSPIITQMMQIETMPVLLRVFLSMSLGILIGFVLPPLATHAHYAHQGYSLYNVGFAGGIIATVIVSVLKSFGITVEARQIWYSGGNHRFAILLSGLFLGMIAAGLLAGGREVFAGYRRVLKTPGIGGTDYLRDEGGAVILFNMGINGMVATAFLVLVGGDLNGPTIGGIMTIVGFSATGKHLRNILPVMGGVFLAGMTKHWELTDPSATLALLFSTTLAPIAGEFGVMAGLIAGFLHSSVALNVGIVYGGMNLYNNGFAGGLVAIFMVPVVQSYRSRKARARGGLSL